MEEATRNLYILSKSGVSGSYTLPSEQYGIRYTVHPMFFPQASVHHQFCHQLPGLLQRADDFVQAEHTSSTGKVLGYEFQELLRRFERIQAYSVRPIQPGDTVYEPAMISINDVNAFDITVAEHVFMLVNSTFDTFYRFAKVEHGWKCAFVHQVCLLADCALLQVLCNGFAEKGIDPRLASVRIVDIERRAYWHASELCRCTYFYSQRSLNAAQFLDSLLCCANNFFESYGATEESQWCEACSTATKSRIKRMQATSPATLCRLTDMVAGFPSGVAISESGGMK